MNCAECEHLDAYVAGWASDDRTAAFEAHLNDCAACREEIHGQRRIDRLLREGTRRLEPIPASLVDRIEGRIGVMRCRRAVRAACGTACAVALLLGVGLWLTTQADLPSGTPSEVAVENRPSPVGGDERPAVEVEPLVEIVVVESSTAIVVPLKTDNPNVSIVWVYPTLNPK